MENIFELKNIRKELKVLSSMINVFIDVVVNGSDYSSCGDLISNVDALIEKIDELLTRFQKLIYIMIENDYCENTETELKYIKGLLKVLKCCLIASNDDYDENGVNWTCLSLSEKCNIAVMNINEVRLLTYPNEDIDMF